MTTTFTMHAGLRTIGGVIFSVVHGRDRVILEMGSAYDPATDYYDGTVERRVKARVRDAIRTGAAPALDGIYAAADLDGFADLVPAEKSELNTAIFITHLHLDHMGAIGYVSPDVPIYLHDDAARIERALERTGDGVDGPPRAYHGFEHGEPVAHGSIEVLPLITNTRSYREFAFLISTPDGTVYWTGDLSLHSAESELTFAHIDVLRERELDVMLCDTTAFMDDVLLQTNQTTDADAIRPSRTVPEGMLTADDVARGMFELLESQRGLAVFNFYPREVFHAKRWVEWAASVGRRCVFEPDAASLYLAYHGEAPPVFVPDSPRYPEDPALQPAWFAEVLDACPRVTADDIRAAPRAYLLQNSYRHVLELFDLPAGGYLHDHGMPIGAFDPAYANLRRVLEAAGFEYFTFFNERYFPHGYPPQVKYFVDAVDPKVLIPCHGFNPERLLPNNGVQLLPELGEAYELADGRLSPIES